MLCDAWGVIDQNAIPLIVSTNHPVSALQRKQESDSPHDIINDRGGMDHISRLVKEPPRHFLGRIILRVNAHMKGLSFFNHV